jgi:hypothetical protein
MKPVIFFIAIIFCIPAPAQDTALIEQYCDVVVSEAPIGSKVTIEIDYGEPRNIFKDNRIKTGEGKPKKFNTVVDALNHMGKSGWKFIQAMPVRVTASSTEYHFLFKKEYRGQELPGSPPGTRGD